MIAALSTMTFAMGRRFVIADGVERWKDADVELVAAAMQGMDGETLTLALFGREESRYKVPDGLRAAVERAGGQIAVESGVKPWELPSWVQARARELGLELDKGAARALVAQVGERQQRLLRELEKLELEHGRGASLGETEIEESSSASSERKVWTLGDALVAGDEKAAIRALVELRGQGERLPRLMFNIADRLRDAIKVAEALAAGKPPAEARKGLRMGPKVAARFVEEVSKRDVDAFRHALEIVADLELESRGGGPSQGALDEDTLRACGARACAARPRARRRRCGAAWPRATSCGRRSSCAAPRA